MLQPIPDTAPAPEARAGVAAGVLSVSPESALEEAPAVHLATQMHASPFLAATRRSGCRSFGVLNGMRVPLRYETPEAEYRKREHGAVLCDASAERHVEVSGPDALPFLQWLTATDVSRLGAGRWQQVLMVDEQGGVVGDPLVLCLGEERLWVVQEHRDLLPWIKGVALNAGLDVRVSHPTVATLAVEGARSPQVLVRLLGPEVPPLAADEVREVNLYGLPLVLSARPCGALSAYSVRLLDPGRADALWERILEAGQPERLSPAAASPVHRIEAGQPGLGFDMDADTDPFEVGLDSLVCLDKHTPFIGSAALTALRARGLRRRLVGVTIDGEALGEPNEEWWPLCAGDERVGEVRSAVASPGRGGNVGLAMVLLAYAETGTRLTLKMPDSSRDCRVTALPVTSG